MRTGACTMTARWPLPGLTPVAPPAVAAPRRPWLPRFTTHRWARRRRSLEHPRRQPPPAGGVGMVRAETAAAAAMVPRHSSRHQASSGHVLSITQRWPPPPLLASIGRPPEAAVGATPPPPPGPATQPGCLVPPGPRHIRLSTLRCRWWGLVAQRPQLLGCARALQLWSWTARMGTEGTSWLRWAHWRESSVQPLKLPTLPARRMRTSWRRMACLSTARKPTARQTVGVPAPNGRAITSVDSNGLHCIPRSSLTGTAAVPRHCPQAVRVCRGSRSVIMAPDFAQARPMRSWSSS